MSDGDGGMGDGAWGMGNGALGIGHYWAWALGIGHYWAWVIISRLVCLVCLVLVCSPCPPSPSVPLVQASPFPSLLNRDTAGNDDTAGASVSMGCFQRVAGGGAVFESL
ncbi:MAG: hypothetical protein VKL59_20770 [Nostocaceae cyanobacterium]|nr:hypothetical protein [Nostocaceae cyanobacterium]